MIKFIIETVTSERDVNGNCYHFAVVTRTDNRERFVRSELATKFYNFMDSIV